MVRSGSSIAPTASAPGDGRRTLGMLGEEMAADHFLRLGFAVVARNVRTRYGEIDLIVFDGRTLVFAEVKTKRASARNRGSPRGSWEEPLAWLSTSQRVRLRKLASAWLSGDNRPRLDAETIRFDAVGVIVDSTNRLVRLDHVEGAW